MGYVYFGQGAALDKFTIGSTNDLPTRKKPYIRSDPTFTYRRVIEEPQHSACEGFLQRFFADRREVGTKSWFFIAEHEIEGGLNAWRELGMLLEEQKEAVERLKVTQSNGKLRSLTEEIKPACERLRELRQEINRLSFEQLELELKIKLFIGDHDGIDGFATWKSQEERRLNTAKFKSDYADLFNSYCESKLVRKLLLK